MDLILSTFTSIGDLLLEMRPGILNSLLIFALTLLFSLPLGLLVAFGRMSKFPVISTVFKFYISVMRGTPLMLQLIIIYFVPWFVFGMPPAENVLPPIILGFSLNYAAYFAEIYRGGIESIAIGQYEASKVLGLSRPHTFMRIILPQVIKRILPSVTNEIITLVKDTSLASVLLYEEMFNLAQVIANRERTISALLAAGLFYYVFNLLVAFVMGRVEKKLSYYQ